MAVAFVSVASTAATFGSVVTSASVTVTAPTSIATGNLLIAVIYDAASVVFTVGSLPSGWTQAALFTPGSNTNGGTVLVAYKYATGSEPANYAFTLNSVTGFQQTPGGVILQYSGTAASSPIDASGATRNATTSTSLVAPSVTSTAANDLLVCAFGCNNNRTVTGRPAGMTSRANPVGGSNSGSFDVCDVTLGAAGASGTQTETVSSATSTISASIAILSDGIAPASSRVRPAVFVRSNAVSRAAVI